MDTIVNPNVKWMNKPMNIKVFHIFCIVTFFMWFIFCSFDFYDTDLPFIIANGRQIMSDGLSFNSTWLIDEIPFVLQQWLYSVLLATADSFGFFGLWAFLLIQLSLILLAIYDFFKIRGAHKTKFVYIFFFFILLSNPYSFNLRPQNITVLLLLIEILGIEHFRVSGKWAWLILLPVSMILEMNFHMTMWPMHYAILLAYFVPAFYTKRLIKTDLLKHIIPVVIFTILMTISMICNPYGMNGITFIVKSMTSGMSSLVPVAEHRMLPLFSAPIMFSLVMLSIGVFLLVKKCIVSAGFHIILGFSLATCFSAHFSMFLPISMVYVCANAYVFVSGLHLHINWQKDVINSFYLIFAFAYFGIIIFCVGPVLNYFSNGLNAIMANTNLDFCYICDYFDIYANKTDRICGGYVGSNYLEYRGYMNIYMDARPESYSIKVNDTKDILRDYSRYAYYGVDIANDSRAVDTGDVDAWLDMYSFDYILISPPNDSTYLHGYLDGSKQYEKIDYLKNNDSVSEDYIPTTILYHKIT